MCRLLSQMCRLLSPMCRLLSSVCELLSPVCRLLSPMCMLVSLMCRSSSPMCILLPSVLRSCFCSASLQSDPHDPSFYLISEANSPLILVWFGSNTAGRTIASPCMRYSTCSVNIRSRCCPPRPASSCSGLPTSTNKDLPRYLQS